MVLPVYLDMFGLHYTLLASQQENKFSHTVEQKHIQIRMAHS
jgi:hypothetical protein